MTAAVVDVHVGAWQVGQGQTQDQWIEADLQTLHLIVSVTTQGRSHERHASWVKTYRVSYSQGSSQDNDTDFVTLPKLYQGNTDQETKVTNNLPRNTKTRLVRILPIDYEVQISMRFDVSGCPLTGQFTMKKKIINYPSSPTCVNTTPIPSPTLSCITLKLMRFISWILMMMPMTPLMMFC